MPDDFSDLITTVSPSSAQQQQIAPDFSDLTTNTPFPGVTPQPNMVVNPNLLTQQWAGNPVEESKLVGYEAGKGATFGLSEKLAPEELKQEAAQYEQQHPIGSAVAQVAGAAIPGYLAPEVLPGFGAESSLITRIGANTALGAGVGATTGATENEGDPVRNALYGGIAGAVTGAGAGLLGGNVAPVVRKIVSGGNLDFASDRASQLIAQRIAQDAHYGSQGAAGLADTLDRVGSYGVPLGMIDVGGENLRGLAGNLYRAPGESRAAISNYFTARDAGATNRLLDAIDGSVATGSKTADEAIQEQLKQRNVAAAPLYDALYDRYPVVSSDRLNQFIADPIMQQGLANGIKVQRLEALAEGRQFDPQAYTVDYNEAGDPVWKGTPNLRTLDAAKRGLDDMLSSDTYRNQYGRLTQMGNAINRVRSAYVDELDSLTGGPDGAYAQARAAWAGPSRAMEMVQEGSKWMSKDPGQLSREVSTLSPNDKDFYLLGVANDMRNKVLSQTGEGNEAARILNSPMARNRAQAVFDPDAYKALTTKVLGEQLAFKTQGQVTKGSQTAARTAEDTSGHGGGNNSWFWPMVMMGAEHNPALAGVVAGYKGLQKVGQWLANPTPAVRAEAARMMTGSSKEQAATLRGISGITPSAPRLAPALVPGVAGIMGHAPGEFFREPVAPQARGGII
jgi:hypothetical protein